MMGVGASLPDEQVPELTSNQVTAWLFANPDAVESVLSPVITAETIVKLVQAHPEFITKSLVEQVIEIAPALKGCGIKDDLQNERASVICDVPEEAESDTYPSVDLSPQETSTERNFLINALKASTSASLILDMSKYICSLVGTDYVNIFIRSVTERDTLDRYIFAMPNAEKLPSSDSIVGKFPLCKSTAWHVYQSSSTINVSEADQALDFNPEMDTWPGANNKSPMICWPIKTSSGPTLGVVSCISREKQFGEPETTTYMSTFSHLAASCVRKILFLDKKKRTLQLYARYCIKNAMLYHRSREEIKKNKVLLALTESIFKEDEVSAVIQKIMSSAQDMIKSDQVSLFLVDKETEELCSTVFDGNDSNSRKEIRFPMNVGVAGHVATTGELLNIKDAYDEPRFNKAIDIKTGYRTTTMLCMPISDGVSIVGVATLINKLDGTTFTKEDEETFNAFSAFCGLCLHKALMYDRIKIKEQQLNVTLEMLSYHSAASEEDAKIMALTPQPKGTDFNELDVDSFDFDPHNLSQDKLAQVVIYMADALDLCGKFKIPRETLCRFVLTIQKNYRSVLYHNFFHAVAVTHGIYILIKKTSLQKYFSDEEIMALFIAALCHDVDHRGTNNQFQEKAQTPLAQLYGTSVMERHHFNHTCSILQSEGHNIFAHMPPEQYNVLLHLVEQGIIATDLALFFKQREAMAEVSNSEKGFDMSNPEHQKLMLSIIMPACDLSSTTKPWEYAKHTAEIVYQEFFQQGDQEKEMGIESMALMNRENKDKLPKMQLGFIQFVVEPVYKSLLLVLPEADHMLKTSDINKEHWVELQKIAEESEENKEN